MKISVGTQLFMRLPPAIGLALFVLRAYGWWSIDASPVLVLLVISETLTILIYLTARASKEFSIGPVELLSTLFATFYLLFIDLKPGPALVPVSIATSLQCLGMAFQICSKAVLGRSFGLLPANKGIVARGPYRLVRHPIYLGYFVTHVGFLLGSWNVKNLILFLFLYVVQFIRIFREESLLKRDPDYLAYCKSTRYRFLPWIV